MRHCWRLKYDSTVKFTSFKRESDISITTRDSIWIEKRASASFCMLRSKSEPMRVTITFSILKKHSWPAICLERLLQRLITTRNGTGSRIMIFQCTDQFPDLQYHSGSTLSLKLGSSSIKSHSLRIVGTPRITQSGCGFKDIDWIRVLLMSSTISTTRSRLPRV